MLLYSKDALNWLKVAVLNYKKKVAVKTFTLLQYKKKREKNSALPLQELIKF